MQKAFVRASCILKEKLQKKFDFLTNGTAHGTIRK